MTSVKHGYHLKHFVGIYSIVQFTILIGELIYCCPLSPRCTLPVRNWPCKIAMRDRFHGGACVDARLMRSCTCSISSVLWLRRFKRTAIDQDTSEGPPTAISIRASCPFFPAFHQIRSEEQSTRKYVSSRLRNAKYIGISIFVPSDR
jgi:hypothetical protein